MEMEQPGTPITGKALGYAVVRQVFTVALLVKGFNGIAEIFISALFFIFNRDTIHDSFMALAGRGTAGISEHFASDYLAGQAVHFSAAKYFIAFYFLFYGVTNIFVAIALLKGKIWAYPVAIIATSFFILYLIYRFFLSHSGLLLFFTIIDILLVALTCLEYRRIKQNNKVVF